MLSASKLIWTSCRPLIRLFICTAFGFGLTKADIFPQVASRGAGQIILKITLPCLMFSRIVPSFTDQNINALGPLILVGVIYEILGILMAWIIKQVFWVPHRFRYGILVAGGWANWGDIPTAIAMSITASPPFGGTADQNLSVAYISVFILVFAVSLFPLGGERMVAWDYVGPDVENEEIQEAVRLRRRAIQRGQMFSGIHRRLMRRLANPRPCSDRENASSVQEKGFDSDSRELAVATPTPAPSPLVRPSARKHVSFCPMDCEDQDALEIHEDPSLVPSCVTSPAPTITHVDIESEFPNKYPESSSHIPPCDALPAISADLPNREGSRSLRATRLASSAGRFCLRFATPCSSSIIVALVISLVNPLKALFVPVEGYNHIAPAPDGQPPLSVIMDTASFAGAASVPLGLVVLGSALARLKVPRNQLRTLPIGAISSLAVLKTILFPVIGVLICSGLTSAGIIDKDDKVLRFVCIFFSCLPTATTQVFLTQVYSGTGDAEHLAAFLIPQYIIMFISMPVLTAYTLQSLF